MENSSPSHGYLPAGKFRDPSSLAFARSGLAKLRFSPSFSICDIQIQKQMSRSFGKSSSYRSCTPFGLSTSSKGLAKVSHTFSPLKIVLPKLRPHCSATCPETSRAEHQRKMSFPLSKEISLPPNQESKEHF
ncbi:hypothetical protein KKG24_04765, partial [Patescibacteria group bacterium]|nr:hypothetical protein [Patescibacteria group bacterium]